MSALHRKFPAMVVQFEDFSTEHAFDTLTRYRDKYTMFNDDIQGTGAVILAGFINAIKLSGIPVVSHRIVFFGAGSAGVGVAKQIMDFFIKDGGLTQDQARDCFWLVDSRGLVTLDRGDNLPEHKVLFARKDNNGLQYKGLLSVLDYVKPTALIGLSSQTGAFDEKILTKMADLNDRPIVFPLSNPSSQSECTFEAAMKYTKEKVLFASGTAFPSYTKINGEIVAPGQGNNMYIFPGLGLGTFLSGAKTVTDSMVYASATTLAASLNAEEISDGKLYPVVKRIRQISARVAVGVIIVAVEEGVVTNSEVIRLVEQMKTWKKEDGEAGEKHGWLKLQKFVEDKMYYPKYVADDILPDQVERYDEI
ncbi:hypothetical protein HK096_009511 [Nowakowskiella sp. JEL0078]|nr:hypothetical protein HK096_009511 [Nowakowskiella sp. JEL0078]